jgi:hypothetical protein
MRVTPKEKAEELVLRYLRIDNNTKEWFNSYIAKQCALIAVDEILNQLSPLELSPLGIYTNPKIEYWLEVKQEIEKL